jgi:hypothetical protein
MPGQTSITLSGLLQEIRDQFPSNPPRLGFVCLRHFDCCADVSRNQVPLALAEVIRSSGLPLDVHLTPVSNARECTRLILRVARALCDRRGARTDADFHRAVYYTVSIFHARMSPAPSSEQQRELERMSYADFLDQYEPHRILGFRRRRMM